MKVGKSMHIDPGAIFGVAVAVAAALPEIVNNEWVKAHTSEGFRHLLILVGVVITASRGRVMRREQYRTEQVLPEERVEPKEPGAGD